MKSDNKALELWVGVFVALGILALAMLAFRVGNLSSADVVDGYVGIEAAREHYGVAIRYVGAPDALVRPRRSSPRPRP